MTNTTWDRIQEAAADADMDPENSAAIGRLIGVSPQTVYGWAKGSELKGSNLIALANELRVEPVWLQTGFGPKRRQDFLARHAMVRFFRDARVAAGHTAINDEYQAIGGLAFLRDSLASKELDPDLCKVIRVSGESMMPNIKPDDAVLYDTTDTGPIQSGKIYVIDWGDDGGLVKRLFVEPDRSIIIRSDNRSPEYADRVAPPGSTDLRVHGRVRWIGRWES